MKTFVSTTLQEIVAGITEAQAALEQINPNAKINPTYRPHNHYRAGVTEPKPVEFDVAVSVTEESGGGGKAALKIASFVEIAGEGQLKTGTETVSRIKFTVGLSQPGYVQKG